MDFVVIISCIGIKNIFDCKSCWPCAYKNHICLQVSFKKIVLTTSCNYTSFIEILQLVNSGMALWPVFAIITVFKTEVGVKP